jgi:hypothetical protein
MITSEEQSEILLSDFDIKRLVLYSGNENIYNKRQDINDLATSIRDHGVLEPLIINQDLVIISGNSRYKACLMLGIEKVPIKMMHTNSERHLRKLVVEANRQRVKSPQEVIRELSKRAEVEEAQRICDYSNNSSFDGNLLRDEKKSRSCNPYSRINGPWTLAVENVITENANYLPMSLRAVFYQMMNQNIKLSNSLKHYKKLGTLLTVLREREIVDYDALEDSTRYGHKTTQYLNKNVFIKKEFEKYLTGYKRDLLQTQPFTPFVMVEKHTLAAIIEPVVNKYGIPVFYCKGPSSTSQINDIRNYLNQYDRPGLLFILTDFDPAGFMQHDNYINSLRKLGCEINPVRVGVTLEQIRELNLPADMEAKRTDKNFELWHKATGMNHAWELDAIPPKEMARILNESISSKLDIDAFNREVEIMNQELKDIEKVKSDMQA